MDNGIVKTTAFRDHPNIKALLEEMQDGRRHVRKMSPLGVSLLDEEWDALCYLYNASFSVPKPYKKDEHWFPEMRDAAEQAFVKFLKC